MISLGIVGCLQVPAQPTESAAGSPIGTVSALFLALTVVGVFVLPFKSAFSNPECNEYEEALRWLFASLLAGMLTVFATLKLAHIAPRVGHPESKVRAPRLIAFVPKPMSLSSSVLCLI